ncbi:trimethylguanosine synthase-like [Phalaenopsis equestris]|uniref:trimethylguanosine synthase-like n=1 Tax=Phalaenopsis equestris TaxID=78828 RepID=UPI0009E37112|nr:trimethylguanosine synthase-like [Phalaenopsis equestris]
MHTIVDGEPSPMVLKSKKRKRSVRKTTSSAGIAPCLFKYWLQRYSLFSMFDAGISMDDEAWFSVTPEAIAASHAAHAAFSSAAVVIDCFAGVGGNAIQFAARGFRVVAVEIDPRKVDYAVKNARIYGVKDRIEFLVGDFFSLAPFLKGDVVFISPPWGGPSYSKIHTFTLDMLKPKDGYLIFQAAQEITPNIIMFLPRNVDLSQVEELSWLSCPPLTLKIEETYMETSLKGITAYFGDTALVPSKSSFSKTDIS